MFGLHFGTFWGHPSRIVWLLVGISPLILFVSGLLMWWNRSLSKVFRRSSGARVCSLTTTRLVSETNKSSANCSTSSDGAVPSTSAASPPCRR